MSPTDSPKPQLQYGDVNLDGAINAADALVILKHAARIDVLDDSKKLALADVDHNGVINATDALETLKIAARLRDAEDAMF